MIKFKTGNSRKISQQLKTISGSLDINSTHFKTFATRVSRRAIAQVKAESLKHFETRTDINGDSFKSYSRSYATKLAYQKIKSSRGDSAPAFQTLIMRYMTSPATLVRYGKLKKSFWFRKVSGVKRNGKNGNIVLSEYSVRFIGQHRTIAETLHYGTRKKSGTGAIPARKYLGVSEVRYREIVTSILASDGMQLFRF